MSDNNSNNNDNKDPNITLIEELSTKLAQINDEVKLLKQELLEKDKDNELLETELKKNQETLENLLKSNNDSIQNKVDKLLISKIKNYEDTLIAKDNELKSKSNLIYELQTLIYEQDFNYYKLKYDYSNLLKENEINNTLVNNLKSQNYELNKLLTIKDNKIKDNNKEIESVKNDNSDLKNVILKLNDIRRFLNKRFGVTEDIKEEDNFDKIVNKLQNSNIILNNKSAISNTKANFINENDDFWFKN